ncbi:MAG: hypothetical protein E4H14_06155 [Candidatus Thorarchaeota archaeon]|nr:MAG: hypothetical protein E4H14_06155 [Candidatus Thorarchaeota archaeon]
MGRSRFLLPILFSIVGIAITILAIYRVTIDQTATDYFPFIEGSLYSDIVFVLSAAIPIIALEYFIVAIPLAILFLIGNSFIKAAAYETNIMKIGESFGGIRMIRRAAAPALFSASTAGILSGFFLDLLIIPPATPSFLYRLSGTLMASLLIMPVALALFMPTWILNDAGIVNHLRKGQLDVRQCPHTEGVGRWYSSMLGGYSILAFPIAMFSINFLQPFLLTSILPSPEEIIINLIWIIGFPMLIMAFIVPVILLNEIAGRKAGGFVQGFVKRIGADVVVRSQISRVAIEKSSEDENSGG